MRNDIGGGSLCETVHKQVLVLLYGRPRRIPKIMNKPRRYAAQDTASYNVGWEMFVIRHSTCCNECCKGHGSKTQDGVHLLDSPRFAILHEDTAGVGSLSTNDSEVTTVDAKSSQQVQGEQCQPTKRKARVAGRK